MSQNATLPLVVVKGQGSSLFGRNWLQHIRLNWSSINNIPVKSSVQGLLKKHSRLFREELGTLKGAKAKIIVPPNAQLYFFKPRPLPYALKDKVEKELDRLLLSPLFSFQTGQHLLFLLSRQMAPFVFVVITRSLSMLYPSWMHIHSLV